MILESSLQWIAPLEAAAFFSLHHDNFVFLYSTQKQGDRDNYSYIAAYPLETVKGDTLYLLDSKLSSSSARFDNAWFGYLGYELLHNLENMPRETSSHITLPDIWFTRFGLILCFNHSQKMLTCYRHASVNPPVFPQEAIKTDIFSAPCIDSLASRIGHTDYIKIIEDTKAAIGKGELYQANITRKFMGRFSKKPAAFSIFCRLVAASPSAYSAFIVLGNAAILSSSPESFLRISANGLMESRPIKGTAPRYSDVLQDQASRDELINSEKERAENRMIVDLMRNDMARSAKTGSVKVERLFETTAYTTLHHLESTITAQKKADVSTLEAVSNCFPPGSMTGAPKIRAIQWCMEKENIRRGVYSGALGWFGGDGSCDLSVTIRTLIIEGMQFEFQVGGGITLDSDPEKEWQETIIKAKGIMTALGKDENYLS